MPPRGSQQWIFESTGLCFVSITCTKVRESPLLGNIPPTLTPRGSIIATMRVRASRWSPTVKVGHASAAIERCAARADRSRRGAARRHAARADERGNPRSARAGVLHPARSGADPRIKRPATRTDRAGSAEHVELRPGRSARAMRSGLHVSSGDGFDALPALDQSPRREQTPAIKLDQARQGGRDR
jgi:hypothetical protein